MAYSIFATDTITCSTFDKCVNYVVDDFSVGTKTYAKTPYCNVLSSYTQPQMYYMIDFSSPGIPQQEKYRLTQGRRDYTVNVNWVYDENKNFDSHSMNPNGRPFVIDGRDINIEATNAMGLGGIRFLWSVHDNHGWLYKSRVPFQHYFVDQSYADKNLHRGGTCGGGELRVVGQG